MKIGFIGLGKLGLDCAEVMAEKYTVHGYDIYPRTSELVKVCETAKEMVDNSDWIFIAVQTPHAEGYDGSVPSSHMEPRDFGHDAVKDAINMVNEILSDHPLLRTLPAWEEYKKHHLGICPQKML